MSAFFYVVLSSVGRSLAKGRSPVQVVLLKCLNGFTATEINSESEHVRVPNA